jgi:glutamate-5-semialdehyde dehydrogenase
VLVGDAVINSTRSIHEITDRAERASKVLACADTGAKDQALLHMASLLDTHAEEIVRANEDDIAAASESGIAGSLLNRLSFDQAKIQSRITSLKKIAALPDPVGQVFGQQRTANGLVVGRMRVPLGVIFMIYEARPHVTINAGAFSLKAGNTIICKGGSEAQRCNTLLGRLWAEALETAGLPADAVQVVSLAHQEGEDRPGDPPGGKRAHPCGERTLPYPGD